VVIRPFKVVGTAFHLAHLEIKRRRILIAEPHRNHIGVGMDPQYMGKRLIHGNTRSYLLCLRQRHYPHHLGPAAAEYEIKRIGPPLKGKHQARKGEDKCRYKQIKPPYVVQVIVEPLGSRTPLHRKTSAECFGAPFFWPPKD